MKAKGMTRQSRTGEPSGERGEMDYAQEVTRTHPLATKQGLELFCALLTVSGAMCPKCAYGTRVVSKKWAKCKKCGEKVARVAMEDIELVETPSSKRRVEEWKKCYEHERQKREAAELSLKALREEAERLRGLLREAFNAPMEGPESRWFEEAAEALHQPEKD